MPPPPPEQLPPVLIVGFNRPDHLRVVIGSLRTLAPSTLFVSLDGPRPDRDDDIAACAASRQVVEELIDWPCELHRMYRAANLGCRKAVSSAITEAFESVEELIIIEDDCVVDPTFFAFAATLLERHRTDSRVFNISALNLQDSKWRGDGAYYSSHYFHCWGWATWKRAWQHYEDDLGDLGRYLHSPAFKGLGFNEHERHYWKTVYNWCTSGLVDSWDYHWLFSCWKHGGLTLIPNGNLVTNIGFGGEATHTKDASPTPPVSRLADFRAPTRLDPCSEADRHVFKTTYCQPGSASDLATLYHRIASLEAELNDCKTTLRGKCKELEWVREQCINPWKAFWFGFQSKKRAPGAKD